MSCGCSNTSSITPTTNCGSCGYNCSNCTCPTNPIITPAVVCADPEPCSELFPLECVIYTGADIRCLAEADALYPAILHFLVIGSSNTTSRNFVSILNNINTQLCYLFSKDYISQFLTNIQNDATLLDLFCNIASSCNCLCTLTCPVVTSVIYNLNSPGNDTVTGSFTRSAGGSTISFEGSITGTTLTIDTAPSSPGTIEIGQQIFGPGVLPNTFITGTSGLNWTVSVAHTPSISSVSMTATWIQYITSLYVINTSNNQFYYSSSNALTNNNTFTLSIPSGYDNRNDLPWLVSVQAVDKIAEMLSNPTCTKGTYFPNSSIAVTPDDCGFGQTVAVPALSCPNICINSCESQNSNLDCKNHWEINQSTGNLIFRFTHNVQAPLTYTVDSYTIHWYKQITFGSNILNSEYKMQTPYIDQQVTVPLLSAGQTFTIQTTIPANSSPIQWLLLVTANFTTDPAAKNCNNGFTVRETDSSIYKGSDLYNSGDCNWFIYDI
jgi:hypothetical protein